MTHLLRLLPAALLLAACHTGSANTMVGAASMTSLAVGAAAVNRAAGGCIALCTNGTACNEKTGLCEVLPCRGQCGADEHCEDNFTGGKCVPGATTGVAAAAKSSGDVKVPLAPSAIPPESSGPPAVVPKAEQQPPKGDGK
jgi:hypothetical protein